MNKTIKIYAEVPDDWIEAQRAEDLGAWLRGGKEMIKSKAIEKLVDKIVENTKLPEVKITKEEVKARVIEKLAEKAVENYTKE